jgi:hypothetical protein
MRCRLITLANYIQRMLASCEGRATVVNDGLLAWSRKCEKPQGRPCGFSASRCGIGRLGLKLRLRLFVHHAPDTRHSMVVLTELPRMPPRGTIVAVAFAPMVVALAVLVLPMMMRTQKPGQLFEPSLLRIIQAGIQRLAGIGDALERGACLGHAVGALRQPVERSSTRFIWILRRRFTRGYALRAHLRHVAQRLLEVRPILGLIRRQFETGLERGDARVDKSRPVFRTQPVVLGETRVVAIRSAKMLSVDD